MGTRHSSTHINALLKTRSSSVGSRSRRVLKCLRALKPFSIMTIMTNCRPLERKTEEVGCSLIVDINPYLKCISTYFKVIKTKFLITSFYSSSHGSSSTMGRRGISTAGQCGRSYINLDVRRSQLHSKRLKILAVAL